MGLYVQTNSWGSGVNFSISAKLEERGTDITTLNEAVVSVMDSAVASLAQAAQNKWISLAQDKLKSSRDDYINGLRQSESYKRTGSGDTQSIEITLVGTMPNNYEFGMPSFDMKAVRPGWLGGAKAKRAKDGHSYVVIPIRHSTSDGGRMSYTGKAAAVGDLKTQLRKAVKDFGLDRMMRTATGAVVEGPTARIPKGAPVHPYLQGLVRIQKGASGAFGGGGKQRGSSTLVKFAIMSEKSKPDSWIHPGLKPANLLPEVEQWVDSKLNEILDTILA